MTSNPTSALVGQQLPEYIRGNSPLFGGFLESYYKYAEQRKKSVGLVKNRGLDTDIDETLPEYVDNFYATYGQYLPREMSLDRRNFLKLLKKVYEAKGTEKSLKLIFRALFDEEIIVSYPSEKILKASDGVWERESFVTIQTQFGNPLQVGKTLSINNSFGNFLIDILRIESVGTDLNRYYFKTYTKISVVDDQIAYVYENSVALFVGKVVKSPESLVVIKPGLSWQKGQVLIIPGTGKNTIARVTSLNTTGGVKTVEILEHGFNHVPNRTVQISPFKNKPLGTVIDLNSTLISTNPDVFDHRLEIRDFIFDISESVSAVSDKPSLNGYFLENYVEQSYSGSTVVSKLENTIGSSLSVGGDTLTIDQWLLSRASILYKEANIVNTKGFYKNDSGQLSNQEIRLQDNYFYQAFSYLIETAKDIGDYKSVLNITHPAGTILFADLGKNANFDFNIISSRTFSNEKLFVSDEVVVSDSSTVTKFR